MDAFVYPFSQGTKPADNDLVRITDFAVFCEGCVSIWS